MRGDLKGIIVAWKCVFPNNFNIKSRQFGFTNKIESEKALELAIAYRDISIKGNLNSFNYFLWLGVVAMFGSLLILLILPLTDLSRTRSNQFRPAMKLAFWFFVVDFIILMWIGSQHPNAPFLEIGQIATAFYFVWFLILVPLIAISENTAADLALNNSTKVSK